MNNVMFSRRGFLKAAVPACAAWNHLHGAGQAQPGRPNIVIILADDQGWGDLSVHGNTNLATPHIDSLARDGALFERFYVQPVCSPTRAELLTGHYLDPPLDHNGRAVRGKGYLSDDLTGRAIAFIDRTRARPFLCYLAFNTP